LTPRKATEYPDIAFGADIAEAYGPHLPSSDETMHFAGVKKHTTKQESLRLLKKKVRSGLVKVLQLDDDDDMGTMIMMPETIKKFLRPMEGKAASTRALVDEGKPFVKAALEELDDKKLDMIIEILKKRGQFPEEKLSQVAEVVLPEIDLIDKVKVVLQKTKLELITVVADALASEFNIEQKNGDVVFNYAAVVKIIEDMKTFRAGQRHSTSDRGEVVESKPSLCPIS